MPNTRYRKGKLYAADMAMYSRQIAADNSQEISRLKRDQIRCLREDAPMPVDVYDAASWMAVTALSEMSIAKGGAVVDFPDFTKGKWHMIVDENERERI